MICIWIWNFCHGFLGRFVRSTKTAQYANVSLSLKLNLKAPSRSLAARYFRVLHFNSQLSSSTNESTRCVAHLYTRRERSVALTISIFQFSRRRRRLWLLLRLGVECDTVTPAHRDRQSLHITSLVALLLQDKYSYVRTVRTDAISMASIAVSTALHSTFTNPVENRYRHFPLSSTASLSPKSPKGWRHGRRCRRHHHADDVNSPECPLTVNTPLSPPLSQPGGVSRVTYVRLITRLHWKC